MTATSAPSFTEVDMQEIEAILAEAERLGLPPERCEKLRAIVESYCFVLSEIDDKKATIRTLRELVFGGKTETKEYVKERAGKKPERRSGPEAKEKPKRTGHGRIPADAYVGGERVDVPHETLRPGDACPCCKGTLYGKQKPGLFVRIRGSAPFLAKVYEQERLRCGLCGEVFTATLPPEVGKEEKFDETVPSMVALLRYGNGFPMNRIECLQQVLGTPFPASTQWELVRDAARKVEAVFLEMVNQAGQGSVLMNDDTPMKILDVFLDQKRRKEAGEKLKRTGLQTSGIVSELPDGHRIVLYFTGKRHAGENLSRVLAARDSGLDPPIQMCDGLSHNVPTEIETMLSNCLVHARRHFVDVVSGFPDEVDHVIEELSLVYENDAKAKKGGMTVEERLRFHQEKSAPIMAGLKSWMKEQLEDKKVERNSGLGKAIEYCTKRWEELTLFLRMAGAPLDNSLTERMLKRAVIHRKNSMFYKTENGAAVGDLYMSLIATAKLAKANPFDYLNELQRHADEITDDPAAWMPWNYRETLAGAAQPN
jgi:hypothetical protein